MQTKYRKVWLTVIECTAALLFFAGLLCAEWKSGRLQLQGGGREDRLLVFSTVLFGILQHRRLRGFYESEKWLSSAVPVLIKFQGFGAVITLTTFFVGWISVDQERTQVAIILTALVVAFLLACGFALLVVIHPRRPTVRGTEVIPYEEAQSRADADSGDAAETISWGALRVREEYSEGHFAIVGATGSGKSLSMQQLQQSVLPQLSSRNDGRALIYDAKRDALPILGGMKLSAPIIILNPFDARSHAWDMARDLNDPASAAEFAAILVPSRSGESHPFFTKAAQSLVAGILRSFMRTRPGTWTLRDVLHAAADATVLRRVLLASPETRKLVAQYFEPPDTFRNILQQIATELGALEPIAALWHKSERQFSLHDWLDGNAILVLGSDWTYSETIKTINRVIFRRVTQLVLNAAESRERRTWFFIDELKEAGNLEGLSSLLSFGRSKGVRVAIAFQDIDGLRHVFGERPASEIVGLCRNKTLLRLDSEATARWAAQTVGEVLGTEYTKSESTGPNGESTSKSEHIYKREAVLASEFMRLPTPDAEKFTGYHIVPAIGVYSATTYYRQSLIQPADIPAFVPRPRSEQMLELWSSEELNSFSGKEPVESIVGTSSDDQRVAMPRITRAAREP